jgi:Zn-dependent peptidase ImmA (M78 family)/transcriptional regulator with XRE-family HTH domain
MPENILEKLDPKIVGERLKSARRACGFTQEEVAARLGFARTTVVAIEKAERRVAPDELLALSACYGRSVSELVKQSSFTEALAPRFRAAFPNSQLERSFPEDQLWRVCDELESRTEDYLELEQMCSVALTRDYPQQYPLEPSRINPEQLAEDVAHDERNRLGLGDAPMSDLRALLEEAVGLRIFFYDMPSSVAGIFGYNDRIGGCVGINVKQPWHRGNWSLAHEYAHFLTTRYSADVDVLSGRWGKQRSERFADSFAANFLMPRSGVNRRLSEVKMARKERVTIADLVTLADYFGVSLQAMCLRLEGLKRLQSGSWDRLKSGGLKPDKARQTLGLLRPERKHSEWPVRYLLLAKAAFEKGELSESQLAKKLRADLLSARETMEELDNLVVASEGNEFEVIPVDLASPVPAE